MDLIGRNLRAIDARARRVSRLLVEATGMLNTQSLTFRQQSSLGLQQQQQQQQR